MSRILHSASASLDTTRGLSITPGTGTPRRDVTVPNRNRQTSTAKNEDVGEIENDEEAIQAAKSGKAKPKGGAEK